MRTDRTSLCPRCAMRLGRSPRCPRCGGKLLDLRRERLRSLALRALRRGRGGGEAPLHRLARGYARYVLPAITALAFFAALVFRGTIGIALLAAISAALVQVLALGTVLTGAAIVQAVVWVARKLRRRTPIARPEAESLATITIGPAMTLGSGAERRTRGRVRVPAPALSPLGHVRCAAFRIVGEGPLGPVDDGGGTSFDVVSGETVTRVELGEGSIDIAVTGPPRTVRPDEPLRRFLEDRGILLRPGPVRLAEGTVIEGDDVEVTGLPASQVESDGYRAAQKVSVLREAPGAPLVVRKRR